MFGKKFLITLSLISGTSCLHCGSLESQDKVQKDLFAFPSQLGLPNLGGQKEKLVQLVAEYELDRTAKAGKLRVTAKIASDHHLYSTTQKPGGPSPTKIRVKTEGVTVTGAFQPDHAPEVTRNDIWPGLDIEEHHAEVTWTAPIEFSSANFPSTSALAIQFNALVCSVGDGGNCSPYSETVNATLAKGPTSGKPATTSPTAATSASLSNAVAFDPYRAPNTHGVITCSIAPSSIAPGETARLVINFEPDPGYHIYPFVAGDPEDVNRTLIIASEKSGLLFSTPTTTTKIKTKEEEGIRVSFLDGNVKWEIPFLVPKTFEVGRLPIELMVGYTTCDDKSCDRPSGVKFNGSVTISKSTSAGQPLALTASAVKFTAIGNHPALTTWIDQSAAPPSIISSDTTEPPLLAKKSSMTVAPAQPLTLWHLTAALIGGFILNFMPCVLPVIGLKIMSFIDQSGNDHRRIAMLNVSFVLGLMSVLWLLAIITIVAKLLFDTAFGWGEQFTLLEFKVSVAALLFAMALSFLGVWEIPIPGFATGSQSGKLLEREGFAGAFIKGVLTTILATPCSGPLLGTLFGLSLTQSPLEVLLLYSAVGLGMSAPYLALCFYPGLVKLLPRPGAWMETLKQVLAFPLLLTVVFFIASISANYRIATLTLLIVVWFACWLIGRIPPYAEPRRIRTAWGIGGATIALGAVFSFTYLGPVNHDVPWQPYNEAQLVTLRKQGKTVMIDFTANWCATCQLNTAIAVDRPKVAQLVANNNVVPMLADWSDYNEEIRAKLDEFQQNSIPLLAIYPADASEPILLPDLLFESQVLEALEKAGPSRPSGWFASARVDQ